MKCGVGFPELSPQSFSFNTPIGMCVDCNGLGTRAEMDPELVVPDSSLSIRDGAIAIGSLDTPGLGVGPMPVFSAMTKSPLPNPIPRAEGGARRAHA